MSQRNNRPRPTAPKRKKPAASAGRAVRTKPTATTNKSQRWMAIFAILVVTSLIATTVGPPLIDYLTRPEDPVDFSQEEPAEDPVVQEYLADIEANPDDAEAYAALGNYLGNTGRVDEAIPYYERALEIDPANVETRLGFARVLANGEKRADAELQFEKVIAADPSNPLAYFSLGQLYANWVPAKTEQAIAAYQKTLELAGSDSFIRSRAIEELEQLGAGTPVAATPIASPVVTETTP